MSMTTLLDIWDAAKSSAPPTRARVLIEHFSDLDHDNIFALSLGLRDRALLAIRRALFGSRAELMAACPACGGRSEFEIELAVIEQSTTALDCAAEVTVGDIQLVCRPPTQGDLAAAVAGNVGIEISRRRLFEACVIEATREGESVEVSTLGEDAVASASAMFADFDSAADIRFPLSCECGHAWEALFDPPSLLWTEFDAWARGQLEEIRQLALTYGWTERDILGMSQARRQFYLGAAV
jgi:hypothetical protein